MSFEDRLATLAVDGPLPDDQAGAPLGAAYLPDIGRGIDLAAHGYQESEFLLTGVTETWRWNADFDAQPTGERRFRTRILVRRPLDRTRFSGAVYIEPHHPDDDRALTWAAVGPWILRNGHAHVGVTQEPATVPDLAQWDRERYGTLRIDDPSQRWEIVGQVAAAVRAGRIPAFSDISAGRVVMSGWSNTGTFCRTYLGEGFQDVCSLGGRPVIDGFIICISSGGAGRAGYGSLAEGVNLPADDPRRRIGPASAPVFEILSEGESETHQSVLRNDSDVPGDRYRLYQVAGCGHVNGGRAPLTTNSVQRRRRGTPHLPREIVEAHSDGRMDLVARALFEAMDRLLAGGSPPPRAARFEYLDASDHGIRGTMPESVPLARDVDGNVRGGVRTAWVEVPSATYLPHSTPVPGRCQPAAHAPYSDPRLLADLFAHMKPFSPQEMRRRYGSWNGFLENFERSARSLAQAGWLLDDDIPELMRTKTDACERF